MLRINEENVRVFMAKRGIKTIDELAKRAGVSDVTIRRLFAGEEFRSSTWHGLAEALGVNPIDILSLDGYPAPLDGAPAIARP